MQDFIKKVNIISRASPVFFDPNVFNYAAQIISLIDYVPRLTEKMREAVSNNHPQIKALKGSDNLTFSDVHSYTYKGYDPIVRDEQDEIYKRLGIKQ